MNLILVRHGETTDNSSQRYWGATDVPLSEMGVAQARRLGSRLAAEEFSAAYCSALQRAVCTAEEIAQRHNLQVKSCPELNEVNFGRIEGYSVEEIRAEYPDFYKEWASWDPDMAFPGGESVSDFKERIGKFILRLKKDNPGGSVLVVAHAGSLRMLICNLLELPLSYWRKLKLDLASVSRIELTETRAVLACLNDTGHLA